MLLIVKPQNKRTLLFEGFVHKRLTLVVFVSLYWSVVGFKRIRFSSFVQYKLWFSGKSKKDILLSTISTNSSMTAKHVQPLKSSMCSWFYMRTNNITSTNTVNAKSIRNMDNRTLFILGLEKQCCVATWHLSICPKMCDL